MTHKLGTPTFFWLFCTFQPTRKCLKELFVFPKQFQTLKKKKKIKIQKPLKRVNPNIHLREIIALCGEKNRKD